MARLTLLITAWKKYTQENGVGLRLGCFTGTRDAKGKEKLLLGQDVESAPLAF